MARTTSTIWLLALSGPLLLLLLSPASAGVFAVQSVHSDVLPNGLRFIVAEEPEASVVAVEVIVKAGAADERPSEAGAAHLLEHVLWAYGGPSDPRAMIEEAGGITNAGTLRDFTHYYATVPAGKGAVGTAIRALAAMVSRDRLDESVVTREKRMVVEELAQRGEGLSLLLNDLAFETLYGKDHPYGRRLEGGGPSLQDLDATTLGVFRRLWYVPSNMVVVAVGPVTLAEVRETVEAAFGGGPRLPVGSRMPQPPPRPAPAREVTIGIGGQTAYLMAAWVGPEMAEPTEVCATDTLTVLLSNVTYGRLRKRLVGGAPSVKGFGVDFLTQRGRAMLGIWAVCEPGQVPLVRKAITEEMGRLAVEPLSPQDVAVAKRLSAAAYAFSNETPTDRARTLAFYEALGTYREAGQYPLRVRGLTKDDLAKVAAWYGEAPTWVTLTPRAEQGGDRGPGTAGGGGKGR